MDAKRGPPVLAKNADAQQRPSRPARLEACRDDPPPVEGQARGEGHDLARGCADRARERRRRRHHLQPRRASARLHRVAAAHAAGDRRRSRRHDRDDGRRRAARHRRDQGPGARRAVRLRRPALALCRGGRRRSRRAARASSCSRTRSIATWRCWASAASARSRPIWCGGLHREYAEHTCCRRRWSAAIRSRTGWSTARCCRRRCRASACARDVAAARAASRRRRTTRPSSPSATWSAPGSTSSPTAKCGAKAIRTASRPRSRASISTIPAHRHGSRRAGNSGAARGRQDPPRARRSRSRHASFCARTPTAPTKITLPGPFTMTQQAKNEFYGDEEELAMDFADAVNAEARDLQAGGRRCDPARRALGAQRSRGGQALCA